jgi:hypothetical protein
MPGTVENNLTSAIVTWIDEHGSYVTKTKLLKLLYLFDVEYYRAHRHPFTDFSWKFFHLGPWAAEYDPMLQGLLACGMLHEQRSQRSEYDTFFYKPGERVEACQALAEVKDEYILRGILKDWGTRTTGEILDYVYFRTEPMEAAIRNQPLDFSLISNDRPQVYSRSSSGKAPTEIRKLRAQFEARRSKKMEQQQQFQFTRPRYDDEFFSAMARLERA